MARDVYTSKVILPVDGTVVSTRRQSLSAGTDQVKYPFFVDAPPRVTSIGHGHDAIAVPIARASFTPR